MIVQRAIAAGVMINSIDGKGLFTEPPPTAFVLPPGAKLPAGMPPPHFDAAPGHPLELSNYPLETLAYDTGGSFFHSNNDLVRGFREALGPATRYLLGFAPGDAPDEKYHVLKVKIAGPKSYSVNARPGYWDRKDDAKSPIPDSEREAIDRVLLGGETLDALPVTIDARNSKLASGAPAVVAEIHVDIGRLGFLERDGRRRQTLTFVATVTGDGGLVTGKVGVIDLALKNSTFQKLSAQGINATLALPALPGAYRVRAVARDRTEGKLSAVTRECTVR